MINFLQKSQEWFDRRNEKVKVKMQFEKKESKP